MTLLAQFVFLFLLGGFDFFVHVLFFCFRPGGNGMQPKQPQDRLKLVIQNWRMIRTNLRATQMVWKFNKIYATFTQSSKCYLLLSSNVRVHIHWKVSPFNFFYSSLLLWFQSQEEMEMQKSSTQVYCKTTSMMKVYQTEGKLFTK